MDAIPAAGRLATLAALAMSTAALAQDPPPEGSTAEQIERIRQELEAVRSDNARLRGEVDELRAESRNDWLTETRADEIRALIGDVLADADTRASLLQDGLTAGWSDGFFLASPDGRFKLAVDGQIQTRFVWNYHDQPDRNRHGWDMARARLTFRGHVFSPDVTFLMRWGLTRDDSSLVDGIDALLDAWVRVALNNEMSIRVGQFKAPFMREELVDSSRQLAVERSLVNQSMSIDRTQGLEFQLAWDNDQITAAVIDGGADQLSWEENFFRRVLLIGTRPVGPAQSWSVEDSEFTIAGRWEHLFAGSWGQFADFTSKPDDEFGLLLGAAGFYQVDESNGQATFGLKDEVEWWGLTADVSVEMGGANAFVAGTFHYADSRVHTVNVLGIVAQGGIYLTPKVEAFGRFEYGTWDVNSNFIPIELSNLYMLTVGANYYMDGHDLKWTTDLGIAFDRLETAWVSDIAGTRPEGPDAEPQIVFRTQFQLLF